MILSENPPSPLLLEAANNEANKAMVDRLVSIIGRFARKEDMTAEDIQALLKLTDVLLKDCFVVSINQAYLIGDSLVSVSERFARKENATVEEMDAFIALADVLIKNFLITKYQHDTVAASLTLVIEWFARKEDLTAKDVQVLAEIAKRWFF